MARSYIRMSNLKNGWVNNLETGRTIILTEFRKKEKF